MKFDVEGIAKDLAAGIPQIVKGAAGEYASAALHDSQAFLESCKELIATWAQQLNEGKLTRDEFAFLARGRLEGVAKMHALAESGIAAATLDATKEKIVAFAITTISSRIPV